MSVVPSLFPPLEWRLLMSDVSNELSQDNLESLKFFCAAEIPTSSVGKCTDGKQLVTLLKEYDKISEGDCTYLIDLLDRAGRPDLSRKLHDAYETREQERFESLLEEIRRLLGFKSLFEDELVETSTQHLWGKQRKFKRLLEDQSEEISARRHALDNLRGYCNFKVGQGQQAVKKFKRILKEDPDDMLALLNVKFIYEQQGSPWDATYYEQQLKRILESGSVTVHVARARYERAEILTSVGAYKQKDGEREISKLFREALSCEGIGDLYKKEWEFGYEVFCFKVDSSKNQT